MITSAAFYVFSAILLASAAMVVTSRNPVHSVLFLILAFFNAAALFLIAGAEFLAMILVIVYVGAVAVLFLFVVMMLDVDFVALREGFQRYAPVGATVGVVLLTELLSVLFGWRFSGDAPALRLGAMPGTGGEYARHRRDTLHQLHFALSVVRPDSAGCHDRRDRADASRPSDIPPSGYYGPAATSCVRYAGGVAIAKRCGRGRIGHLSAAT